MSARPPGDSSSSGPAGARLRAAREVRIETARITDLAHDGRGVAQVEGKIVFIDEALPGEQVEWTRLKRSRNFDEGRLVRVLDPSPDRVSPRCAHFGVCGGCALQHLSSARQIEFKQRQLHEALVRIGKVAAAQTLPFLQADAWNYRRRARLAARWVPKKNRTVVGFRERSTPYIADLKRCEVMQEPLDALIEPLSQLLSALSIRHRVPQIEVAIADNAVALVMRVLERPTSADLAMLQRFALEREVRIYLQPGGYETVTPLADYAPDGAPACSAGQAQALSASARAQDSQEASDSPDPACAPPLQYRLSGVDVTLQFLPTDFVQVNARLNASMVERALELLSPAPGEQVLDLFCGLGNFSLPLARSGAWVVGVEGDASLVARARVNAQLNGLSNAEFFTANLADLSWRDAPWGARRYDKILLDPPRAGAKDVLPLLARSGAAKVLYVSCHPGSLARDAGILVHEHGYTLQAAGVMDMFPHTAHVESVALFTHPAK